MGAGNQFIIPIHVQDETKARRIPVCWQGASEAHIRSDLRRASNAASSPEDKRISLILNVNWNYTPCAPIDAMRRNSHSAGSIMSCHPKIKKPALG